jgi:hypothetical protein
MNDMNVEKKNSSFKKFALAYSASRDFDALARLKRWRHLNLWWDSL